MSNDVSVNGKIDFMGINIPIVYGGFGEDKMCVADKTVAEIHGQPTYKIRQLIKNNIRRFKDSVDIIDLKRILQEYTLLEQLGYAKQSIKQAEHIYLLSERGYAKLIKIMDDDKSWEVHDKLVDEYFNLREEVERQPQPQIEMSTSDTCVVSLLELYDLTGHDKEKTLNIFNGIRGNKNMEEVEDININFEIEAGFQPQYYSITELAESELVPYSTTMKINQELRSRGIITRQKDNKPYQKYIDLGYFKWGIIKEYENYGYKNEPVRRRGWVLTPKGWEWIIGILQQENK